MCVRWRQFIQYAVRHIHEHLKKDSDQSKTAAANNQSTPASETENSMQKRSMPSKMIKLGKQLSKVVTADPDDLSITSLTGSVSKPRKVSLEQATVSLDQASSAFKKSRISKNCESTTLSAEGMFPWEGYMDEDFDNNVDPDPDYEPLYDDEVCID